ITSVMTRRKCALSVCFERISRHCTSGRPAPIMVANCRVKMASSFTLTPVLVGSLRRSSLGFSISEVIRTRRLRRYASASSWLSYVSSPPAISPETVLPFHRKVGIPIAPGSGRDAAVGLAQQLLQLLRVLAAAHGLVH